MNQQIPVLFEANDFLIDQKVNMFKFANEYKIFNLSGERVGSIKERLSVGRKLLVVFMGKGAIPFHFEIVDNEENVLAVISKGWTWFLSKIFVKDSQGKVIGILHQKFRFLKPTFHLYDAEMRKIGEIKGDWRAWNFQITNENGTEIGTINKKWSGIMKEAFTTADKYHVSVKEECKEDTNKIVIVSTAISIDMILKERK